jgi:hypothetical protein
MDCIGALRRIYESADNRPEIKPDKEAILHLQQCFNCQKLVKLDDKIRDTVKSGIPEGVVSPGLATRVKSSINHINSLSWREKASWLLPGKPWGWLSTATAMILILILMVFWTFRLQPSASEWFVEKHAQAVSQGYDLDFTSSDPTEIDQWFYQELGFTVNAAKFATSGLQLVGSRKVKFDGMASALACLRKGESQVSFYAVPFYNLNFDRLQQQMVDGREVWTGTHKDYNIVVWQEIDQVVTCSLVANLPLDELIALAESLQTFGRNT